MLLMLSMMASIAGCSISSASTTETEVSTPETYLIGSPGTAEDFEFGVTGINSFDVTTDYGETMHYLLVSVTYTNLTDKEQDISKRNVEFYLDNEEIFSCEYRKEFEDFFEDPRHNKDEKILKLLHSIVNDAYEKYGVNQLNESQWDFRHIDPLTGMPRMKERRQEDDIKLMNQHPGKTGWIILLQNRVNLNSVGNMRYKKRMWYDMRSRTVSSDRDMSDAILFSQYILPNAGKPAGWLYDNEL